jgi:hypothetical protein
MPKCFQGRAAAFGLGTLNKLRNEVYHGQFREMGADSRLAILAIFENANT